jgi:acetyltransferase-like isoleucine patch superfamily enzyme
VYWKKQVLMVLSKTHLRYLVENGLLGAWRLLLVNWLFQRVLGINGEVKWSVHYTSCVTNANRIQVGATVKRSFAMSGGCYIQGGNGIQIGDGTIFAAGVKIISANHDVESTERVWQESDPIVIGRNCWIGANAVILPGVQLGDRVVVGAGAVVTRSFPSDLVIAGVPAEVLRRLNGGQTT